MKEEQEIQANDSQKILFENIPEINTYSDFYLHVKFGGIDNVPRDDDYDYEEDSGEGDD